ncbi:ribosomal protein S10 [Trichodelitschia bisporula]|uniref:Small ribosomal subunit protein uS10m n=1 Tax=Trichodelitschia bisporula TaxID=703511 RepID=A0A6G1I8Y7_9PEZI|nr:ribosomal protein S10 [Trichodelitschia bisporula]
MAAPAYWRSPFSIVKRLRISPSTQLQSRCQRAGLADISNNDQLKISPSNNTPETLTPEELEKLPVGLRNISQKVRDTVLSMPLPMSVQAAYLRPMRRPSTLGLPVCDLQLRSYSIRNLEFFADFALRAAYYLGLPAKGPVPLPRITERWTVPRSNFVHKKSQENFERITLRRLIQIQDGHPDVVQCWLGYLERRSYHGIGMKANVWEWEGLKVGKRMDEQAKQADQAIQDKWGNFGVRVNAATAEKMEKLLSGKAFSQQPRPMEAFIREPIEIKRG